MDTRVNNLLLNLETEIKSFKEKEDERLQSCERRLKKLEDGYDLAVKRPFTSTEISEDCHYKKQLNSYLKKGSANSIEIKSNGFPLTDTLINSIHEQMKKLSPIRKLASVNTISTDCITYISNGDALEAQWVSEDEITNSDAKEHIITTEINTYELYTQPKTTQKVLDDPSINVEKWLIEQAALAFTQLENETFITGDGKNKPHGILQHNTDSTGKQICKITSKEKDKITPADILSLYYGLQREFSVNGTFLMHSTTIQLIRGLKYEQTGHYMFQPGILVGQPDTLMGIPVIECSEMPIIPISDKSTSSTKKYPIIFGDFKRGYQIVDRSEMRVLRDPYSAKPYVSFYITKRVGAKVINPKAFVFLEMKS
ncbi:phage major capsid protein [Neorickettsia sennetsu]|uniref:Phage major capsid protein, HK97 family n=1 Tax=Ehrlichia sennetsu (strain ATCC VR-367 / Miyayama) TaxID=222891 RepID=Q2GDU5_EHRS3|nr:phage major capsid protein [Neorickettsia sennetsu]ABD46410.1 phage major capsid protein, HK97 family [Neorickettsia sennetsu str. Miyayama]